MLKCSIFNAQCQVKNGVINPEWARDEIVKMSEWQHENYGSSADTSAFDTAKRLLREYFKITNYEVRELNNVDDLKSGIWIVPMDGQALGNPNFTSPGPERHMLVVIGYDQKINMVVTNDPGTRMGKGYKYDAQVFWDAIRDYPTGDHQPINETVKRGIRLLEQAR
jgi:hypothetical protein